MYYQIDYIELPKSSDDLMTNADRSQVKSLFNKYKSKDNPHKAKGLGEMFYLGAGGLSFGAAALWFAADVAFLGMASTLSIAVGCVMLGFSEYKRQGDRCYHWQNAEGQSVISSRKIARTIGAIESRLKSAFKTGADTYDLDKDVDYLSQFVLTENKAAYKKPLKPLI